jgi:hypothetical protein
MGRGWPFGHAARRTTGQGSKENNMKKPVWLLVGGVLAIMGLLFTLQGADVIGGSSMSGSAFWAVAGPIIILIGLSVAAVGARGRVR